MPSRKLFKEKTKLWLEKIKNRPLYARSPFCAVHFGGARFPVSNWDMRGWISKEREVRSYLQVTGFFLSGIFTFVIGCAVERKFLTMKRSSVWHIFRQGLLQTTVQYVCFYIGLACATGAKSSIINASQGFVAIIASHFMLKSEKMTWKKTIGCILGLAGVVTVNLSPGAWGSGFSMKGEGMILICTIVYGISMVLLKMISDEESPMTITAYQTLMGGALLILIGIVMGGHVGGFTAKSAALLIYMALLSTAAFSIWTILMKYNPVGKVAVYTFTIPIFRGGAVRASPGRTGTGSKKSDRSRSGKRGYHNCK